MDDEDRSSASSAESEREHEQYEAMEDGEDANNDHELDEDNDDDDEDGGEDEADGEDTTDDAQKAKADEAVVAKTSKPATPVPWKSGCLPTVRPEALTAKLYDIVPTMAAPQATSINAMAITPDQRYWITGGSDGYIRKYDGPGTINGKLALTVAQKHPFVDSVTKAGILMSYWENEEPSPPSRGDQDHFLSPVYSLAVHSRALWLLSGLESGGINLQSVRHDEGKRICCLQQHTNAVSVLTLAPDERSVLSGGWDKKLFDWDLNTGDIKRSFDGNGGQISSIELRPASGLLTSTKADEPVSSSTMTKNNGAPQSSAMLDSPPDLDDTMAIDQAAFKSASGGQASPAHESLFGGSDTGSLFGETAGGQLFGHDDDGYDPGMGIMGSHESGMDHSADQAMTDMTLSKEAEGDATPKRDSPGPTEDAKEEAKGDAKEDAKEDVALSHTGQPERPDGAEPPASQRDARETQKTLVSEGQDAAKMAQSPTVASSQASPQQLDPSQMSATTFLSSAIDGTIRIWDRRVPDPVARIGTRVGVPPWCMSACWSPDGNMIYAGRRNGTVEEFDVRRAKRAWEPERTLRFPAGSGAVSALKPMVNGRHLVCASHDILRLYDLQDPRAHKHSTVPFLIIPGPPRAGVISSLYIDPTSRFMLSAAGTRGWDGTCTEVLIGYEIHVVNG